MEEEKAEMHSGESWMELPTTTAQTGHKAPPDTGGRNPSPTLCSFLAPCSQAFSTH